ncbi:hypothetical protein A2U01_0042383, partial [Trifolium medium]|nr:hypothetical protein [Trifolium medium]
MVFRVDERACATLLCGEYSGRLKIKLIYLK